MTSSFFSHFITEGLGEFGHKSAHWSKETQSTKAFQTQLLHRIQSFSSSSTDAGILQLSRLDENFIISEDKPANSFSVKLRGAALLSNVRCFHAH